MGQEATDTGIPLYADVSRDSMEDTGKSVLNLICMSTLSGKVMVISGASRGIGKAIAIRAARDGACVALIAKTAKPHPKLPGTVFSAAQEVEQAGGKAMPLVADVRDEDQVQKAISDVVKTFGGIDILVNNASAISLTGTAETTMKKFDLMQQVNVRATYMCTQAALPFLKKSNNPHILMLAPPINLDERWLKNHVAYTISKYGMSLCVIGHSAEFASLGIAVNALWPKTTIATAAIRMLLGEAGCESSRSPAIVAEAAHQIVCRSAAGCTGNFFIDEEVLREVGIEDFSQYAVNPEKTLSNDLFLE